MARMRGTQILKAPRAHTPIEVKRLGDLEQEGQPYLVMRDGDGAQVTLELAGLDTIAVGRGDECELAIAHDKAVSRLHSELVRRAGEWMVLDDGLSRNGTYVNGDRVQGRRRLLDGDVLGFGATAVLFRDPRPAGPTRTAPADQPGGPVHLSPAQRRVLIELCRPFTDEGGAAHPATNREIAARLVISDSAVKSHMRALFERFDVKDLNQNAKRSRVVDLALRSGTVSKGDGRRGSADPAPIAAKGSFPLDGGLRLR
jgi:hypothetical protein